MPDLHFGRALFEVSDDLPVWQWFSFSYIWVLEYSSIQHYTVNLVTLSLQFKDAVLVALISRNLRPRGPTIPTSMLPSSVTSHFNVTGLRPSRYWTAPRVVA